jgi:hypothetical protein
MGLKASSFPTDTKNGLCDKDSNLGFLNLESSTLLLDHSFQTIYLSTQKS